MTNEIKEELNLNESDNEYDNDSSCESYGFNNVWRKHSMHY